MLQDNVMVKIKSIRRETAMIPVDPVSANMDPENNDYDVPQENGTEEPEVLEMISSGSLFMRDDCIVLSYAETELTGMEGAQTEISFPMKTPGLVSMCRTGTVTTTLVFEQGKRSHCVYETPFMPFEVCVHTFKVVNRLVDNGTLELDYTIEIRGACAERTKLSVTITPNDPKNGSVS